jgi:hypothetical protein
MNKQKIEKEMPDFISEVAGLSVEELNARLSRLAKDYEAIEEAKEADEGLREAQDTARELRAPYADGKKAIRMKSSYIVALVKEKGGE